MTDQDAYAVAAEFYDLWAVGQWAALGPAVVAALDGLDPAAGPVVDLGGGTGLGTLVVADALPSVRLLAVEPSRAMRAGFLTRLGSRPDLHPRVTLLPTDLAGFTWPDQVAGVVAMAMLGHLTPSERTALWATLAQRLAPGAPAVVLLQPPARPEPMVMTRHTQCRIGELDYEGWAGAEPTGPRSLRWTMRYRVLREGVPLEEQEWTSDFATVSVADLEAEAAAAGLLLSEGTAGLVTLRRPA